MIPSSQKTSEDARSADVDISSSMTCAGNELGNNEMSDRNQTKTTVAEPNANQTSACGNKTPPAIRVYMMDLWSFIPYYIARLCCSLRAESVDVTLGSVRYHLDRNFFRSAGLRPDRWLVDIGGRIRFPRLRRLVKSCEYLGNLFVLATRLAISRPDILHVEYFPFLERRIPLELWFVRWIRRCGIRVVYTVHNVTRQDSPAQGISLFRRAYDSADSLICHGEEARAQLIHDFDVPAEKISLIPHGPLFDEGPRLSPPAARTKLGLPQKEPLILCLGVISEYKGVPFLLRSWKKLKEAGTRGTLLIAGTGDPRILSEIREQVDAAGLNGSVLLWLHFIAVEQLPLVYQAADILVYPYKACTTSGALLTGLNYGKAVVATTLPFFHEYLKHGVTGLLVDYGAEDALTSALQSLILQPQELTRMAAALSRETSNATGWQEIARKTRECYQTTLAR